jgi:hypothetical protein
MIFMPGSAAYVSEIAPTDTAGRVHGALHDVIQHCILPWAMDWGASPPALGPAVLWAAAFGSGCLSTLLLIRVPQLPQAREDCDLPD